MQGTLGGQRIERLSMGLRWAILLGLALLLAAGGMMTLEMATVFGLGALWSLLLLFKGEIGGSLLASEWVQMAGDALLGASLFFFSGTLLGPLVWAGLLPVVYAGLSNGISGGLLAGLVGSAAFGLLALVDVSIVEVSNLMRIPALAFVVAGFLAGALAQRSGQVMEPPAETQATLEQPEETPEESDTQPSDVKSDVKLKALAAGKQLTREIAEESRKQMARRLHDGAIQSVAAIAMRVNLARRMLGRDVDAAGEEMQKVEDLARRTTKEIRHLLFTMRPQSLEASGLVAALNDLAEQTEDAFEQPIEVELDAKAVRGMDAARQSELFYAGLEGLLNALQHAEAQHIWLRLTQEPGGTAKLEVEDDGKGFTPPRIAGEDELQSGLAIANARAELAGGSLEVDSKRGQGTRYVVRMPISEPED